MMVSIFDWSIIIGRFSTRAASNGRRVLFMSVIMLFLIPRQPD